MPGRPLGDILLVWEAPWMHFGLLEGCWETVCLSWKIFCLFGKLLGITLDESFLHTAHSTQDTAESREQSAHSTEQMAKSIEHTAKSTEHRAAS